MHRLWFRKMHIPGLAFSFVTALFLLTGCENEIVVSPKPIWTAESDYSADPAPVPRETELQIAGAATFVEAYPLKPDGGVWIDLPWNVSGPWKETKFLYQMSYNPAVWTLVKGDSIKEPPYRLVMKADRNCFITSTFPGEYGPGMVIKKEQIEISNIQFTRSGLVLGGKPFFSTYCSNVQEPYRNTCYALRGITLSETCNLESQTVIHAIRLIYNRYYQETH